MRWLTSGSSFWDTIKRQIIANYVGYLILLYFCHNAKEDILWIFGLRHLLSLYVCYCRTCFCLFLCFQWVNRSFFTLPLISGDPTEHSHQGNQRLNVRSRCFWKFTFIFQIGLNATWSHKLNETNNRETDGLDFYSFPLECTFLLHTCVFDPIMAWKALHCQITIYVCGVSSKPAILGLNWDAKPQLNSKDWSWFATWKFAMDCHCIWANNPEIVLGLCFLVAPRYWDRWQDELSQWFLHLPAERCPGFEQQIISYWPYFNSSQSSDMYLPSPADPTID